MSSNFIARVAETAVSDWRDRRIMLPSVVIAQAILESAWGESELAVNAKALFGIKRNDWTGKTYIKTATEQLKDGTYISVKNTEWRAYSSWEESILDHNTYIATREKSVGVLRYAAIIGNTDHKAVCQLLKDCGYATSLTYPEKLLNLIDKHNLTEYDKEVEAVLKIAIDAGHGYNTAGKRCLKSIDVKQTREWTLNSRIAEKLGALLKGYGCEVLRTDDTTGKTDVGLEERCNKANKWGADVFISIHHNAGINGKSGGGTQVYYYSSDSKRKTQAQALYDVIVKRTGLVGNRSSKVIKKAFTVIANTKMPAFLLENGFMDSTKDTPVILTEAHADRTAQGILDFLVDVFGLEKAETETTEKVLYKVQCGAFTVKKNAEALQSRLKAAGFEAVIVNGKGD